MDQETALLFVREQDMKKRIAGGQDLISYLQDSDEHLSWTNIDKIADSLATYWVSSSNYKVALLGLDILSLLLERLNTDFQQHYHLIHHVLVDRLGDQKDQVRDASITLLTNIMDVSSSPQYIFEKLGPAFSHKVYRVRQGICGLLIATINRFGAKSLYLSRLLPFVCKLLSDPNVQVRESANATIVEIYRHVGEKVRQDLTKKGLSSSKLAALFQRFDEVQQSGRMVVSSESVNSLGSSTGSLESHELPTPVSSRVPHHHPVVKAHQQKSNLDMPARASSAQPRRSTVAPSTRPVASSVGSRVSNAGAVDEASFKRDFESNLPSVRIYSPKDLDEQMVKIQVVLSDERKDWEERTKSLKVLRSLAFAGGWEYDNFYQHLRVLEPALLLNAKDLRSQVVRETCVTIGYFSSKIQNSFDHTAVVLLPTLFALLPNSAKVMSTSGRLCISTILQHTHGQKMIPIVLSYITSKSSVIRRHTFCFINTILQHWSTQILERHQSSVKDAIHKGIGDADSEAREESRRCWHSFEQHYPDDAEDIFNRLTAQQQKLLRGRVASSSSNDSSSRNNLMKKPFPVIPTTTGGARRSVARAPHTTGLMAPGSNYRFSRSRSDIDPSSARKSKSKLVVSSGYGTIGPSRRPRHSGAPPTKPPLTSQDRGRNKDRPSASQPGSRSNSPNNHHHHHKPSPSLHQRPGRTTTTVKNSSSRMPVYSRDHSPPSARHNSEGSSGRVHSTPTAQSLRVLPKGKEGELALHEALNRKVHGTYGLSDNEDDFSDSSSVCSDRSASYQPRNGGKRTLHSSTEDVTEVLNLCQSSLWNERKEGLTGLHSLIQKRTNFSRLDIKRIIDIFTRMFADPHGKVFSMFLEMLPDFISIYKEQLDDWLYIVMTQLLKKMGADLLGSVQTKVLKALQVVRESFPTQLQFTILSRYIVDQTQRPSLKVKIALLQYLLELTALMQPSEITNSSDTRLGISRIITWTTEPKSPDIRRFAEQLLIAIFEKNAGQFTMMIRILPKTFQDGAMKVLQGYMQTNGESNSFNPPSSHHDSGGHVVSRVAVSPTRVIVSSPNATTGTVDAISPRSNNVNNHKSENMNKEEIEENFRDITAGIHKLRMDSNAELSPLEMKDDIYGRGDGFNLGESPILSRIKPESSPAHHYGSPKLTTTKYNPTSYADGTMTSPTRHHPINNSFKDEYDDDDFSESAAGKTLDVKSVSEEISRGTDNKHAMSSLLELLKSSNNMGGFSGSQLQNQWDTHFDSVLYGVLGVLRTEDCDTKFSALTALKEMLRTLANRFRNHIEVTVTHILQIHKDNTKEVVKAAEETSTILCSAVQPTKVIEILGPLAKTDEPEIAQACLKMMTCAMNRCSPGDLTVDAVDGIIPGILQCYDSEKSGVRKAAVFCLVALHRVIGNSELLRRLSHLSGGKMKLLQLYIKRSQGNGTTEC